MFRALVTLMRGQAADAEEAFADRNALAILRQNLRDCAKAVSTARKALAIAIAQDRQEIERYDRLVLRIADLESRTVEALERGEDALARDAAETIARLEEERVACEAAQREIAGELWRLRQSVETSEARLRALKRGQRIAAATDQAQRLTACSPAGAEATLGEAEQTLARLRERQTQMDLTCAALDEMDRADDPVRLRDRLAAAGCGAPLRASAEAVLDRLRAKTVATPV